MNSHSPPRNRREEVREVCRYCIHFHHLTDGEARVTSQRCFYHTGAFHISLTWRTDGRGTPWGVFTRKRSGISSSHYSANFEYRHKVVARTLLLCLTLGTFHMLLEVWALSPFRRVPPLTNCADQTERILSPDSLNVMMSLTDNTIKDNHIHI